MALKRMGIVDNYEVNKLMINSGVYFKFRYKYIRMKGYSKFHSSSSWSRWSWQCCCRDVDQMWHWKGLAIVIIRK